MECQLSESSSEGVRDMILKQISWKQANVLVIKNKLDLCLL